MGNYLDLPLATFSELQRETAVHLTYKGKLGGSSFLRTLLCLHSEHGTVVVKVYSIRQKERDEVAVLSARSKMETLAARLKDIPFPHVCLFRHFEVTPTIAYMVRPYIYASLHERATLRPFLSFEEKRWIAFQVLIAVDLAHRSGVRHGDFKTENILVTSWNWVLLSDFAPYKPVYIDITNTADFTYYFDTGGRRRCYLAPERFQEPASLNLGLSQAEITPAMDVFSIGCVIAELFTDEPLFKLSDLIAYRHDAQMTNHTQACLAKLHGVSPELAEMVRHMTQLDPKARLTIHSYLHHWPQPIFPWYFPAVHQILAPLLLSDGDSRVQHLQRSFVQLHGLLSGGAPSAEAPRLMEQLRLHGGLADASKEASLASPESTSAQTAEQLSSRSDSHAAASNQDAAAVERPTDESDTGAAAASTSMAVPAGADAADRAGGGWPLAAGPVADVASAQSMTLLAVVLCCALRGAVTQDSRWAALRMLLSVAPDCDDDCKLQRIVPYLLALVVDQAVTVQRNSTPLEADTMTRMLALRQIIRLLGLLARLPRSDRGLFVEYLLPALSSLPTRGEEMKREYAHCLPILALCALDLHEASLLQPPPAPAESQQGELAHQMVLHTTELRRLRKTMQAVIQEHFQPERARDVWLELLQNAGSLAKFLGPHITDAVLLPSMVWLPNEPSWHVRAAFYRHLPDVAVHVGVFTVSNVFLPVMEATLRQREEPPEVLLHALQALTAILRAELVPAAVLFAPGGVAVHALARLQHPSAAVRAAALHFLQAATQHLDLPELYAFVAPAVSAVTGQDAHGCHLSPLLFGQPLLVAEHMKYQRPVTQPVAAAYFPQSRVEFVHAALDVTALQAGTSYNPLYVADPPSSPTVMCAGCGEPLLRAGESLHSQALRYAEIPLPTSTHTSRDGSIECAASSARGNTADDNASSEDARPTSYYTSHLLQVSQVKANMEPSSPAADGSLGQHGMSTAWPTATLNGKGDFQPRGVLVAHLAEHQHCVNKLAVCHTSQFFASASSDWTVKLWDRRRFDKMVSFQSRLTYSGHDGQVTCVDFISEHCVASADSNGGLHVWDLEYQGGASARPTVALTATPPAVTNRGWRRAMALRKWGPLIILLSERGGLHAFDARASRAVWELPIPASDGVSTCMALMPDGSPAMCTATSRGVVHLWDLRFQMMVDEWSAAQDPIHDIAIPTATPQELGLRSYGGSAPLLYVASGLHQASCWDLDSFRCRQRIIAGQHRDSASGLADSSHSAGLASQGSSGRRSAPSVDAFATGFGPPAMHSLLPLPSGALLTAGSDKCIRYWRMNHPSQSYIVSGPLKGAAVNASTVRSQPGGRSSGVSYVHQAVGDVGLLTEVHNPAPITPADGSPQGTIVADMRAKNRLESLCHRDRITDLAVADLMDPVLLSASRDGIIKAWR